MTRYASFLKNIKLIEFPEFRQTFIYDCGANCMQAILAFNDIDFREEDIMREADTTEEEGTPISGLKKISDKYKLKYKEGTFKIDDLKYHVDKGWPTIVMLQAWSDEDVEDWSVEWEQGHYVIVIGYDNERIYFEDPSSIKRTFLTYEELDKRWRGWDDENKKLYNWGMVFTNDADYKVNALEHMD